MSDGITLRPVRESDHAFLLAVYAGTRAPELDHVPWSAEQKDAFVRMQYTAQTSHYVAEFPQATHEVICAGEIPVGRLYLDRAEDAFKVLDIAVLPEYRRRGIGSVVLRRIQDEARRAGKPVTVYVETFDPSLQLFRQLGFQTAAEQGFQLLLRWEAAG